jgi:hypothetical protein
MSENEIKEDQLKKKLHELKELRRLNAEEILIMDEWCRLSIVDKTALIGAYKNIYPGAKGDLEGALMLFREIKQNQMWHERNIENNYRPIDEHFIKDIKAVKKQLRTPEQVAEEQDRKERASARRQMFQA